MQSYLNLFLFDLFAYFIDVGQIVGSIIGQLTLKEADGDKISD